MMCFYILLHPRTQVVEEVDRTVGDRNPTLDDIKAMSYTRASLGESLRLYPQVRLTSKEQLSATPINFRKRSCYACIVR